VVAMGLGRQPRLSLPMPDCLRRCTPVVAIVLGVLVLNETVTATMVAGIALVLAGIALTRRRTKQASGAPKDTGA